MGNPIVDKEADLIEQDREDKIQATKQECKRRITEVWPLEKQLSADNGAVGYSDQDKAEKDQWVDDHIIASEDLEEKIRQADDPRDIDVTDEKWWP